MSATDELPILSLQAFTIASGQTVSDGKRIIRSQSAQQYPWLKTVPVSLKMPASWTAGDLTFQGSYDDSDYDDLYKIDGTKYTITTPAAGSMILIPPVDLSGVPFLKLVCANAQGADRVLTLALRYVA